MSLIKQTSSQQRSLQQNPSHRWNVRYLALVGLMAAVIGVFGPLVLPLPFSPVPISLASFAVYFSAYVLGKRGGTLSCMIYLFIGLMGVPVFSGFSAGPGKLLGPTGGYLIGYLFMAWLCGFFAEKWPHKALLQFVGMVLGTLACYVLGTIWLSFQADLSFQAALAAGVFPFIPGDLVKIIVSMIVGKQIRRRLQKINFWS